MTAEVWICTKKEENKWDSWDLRWRDCSVEVGDKNQENAKKLSLEFRKMRIQEGRWEEKDSKGKGGKEPI